MVKPFQEDQAVAPAKPSSHNVNVLHAVQDKDKIAEIKKAIKALPEYASLLTAPQGDHGALSKMQDAAFKLLKDKGYERGAVGAETRLLAEDETRYSALRFVQEAAADAKHTKCVAEKAAAACGVVQDNGSATLTSPAGNYEGRTR